MANFLIEISYLNPYPIKKDYRQKATGIGTAINRAIKEWRKESKENGKSVRVRTLNIRATKI